MVKGWQQHGKTGGEKKKRLRRAKKKSSIVTEKWRVKKSEKFKRTRGIAPLKETGSPKGSKREKRRGHTKKKRHRVRRVREAGQ